ncbi:mannitol dehydrogenase family protein [Crateriforma conspicua]|uniref:mannitol dehydrogenase family protein n=1 Tax=Crateriforma conspicua TaxID=2527996 RepID=UPI0011885D4F|nr:mannitol dehydrogenase family protein [Crateriforma conspicua]QDV62320.1 Mannitol 2-dehydrogenase [Crateriforma conspicua]
MCPDPNLNEANLKHLPSSIRRPTYDRSSVHTGIVHIGVGGFFRSHLAAYTDELLHQEDTASWGICGVGIRDDDARMAAAMSPQDGLYSLIVKHPNGLVESSVIGSMIEFVLGSNDPSTVIVKMASPETKIVSLTITEGGYNLSPATGDFDFDHPDVVHDLEHPDQPKSVFGYLTAALKMRRDAGSAPVTILSCDNIQHNGDLTRRMLLRFAQRQSPELATWISDQVTFPNSMVDRITPMTSEADIEYFRVQSGLLDRWPVTCEPFRQWVIEHRFANGRPAWEQVGAQFVADVAPYETMKLRLLNAGHSVLGILGAMHGFDTINECIADDRFAAYLRSFFDQEATPTLDPVPGIDLVAYKDSLIERFGNPSIRDSVSRICLQSSSKLPVFLIPTIIDNLDKGRSIRLATLVIAAWCLYCDRQVDRNGNPLAITDDMKEPLHQAAMKTADDKRAFIRYRPVFGDLAQNEDFATTYETLVDDVYRSGDIVECMQRLLDDTVN